MNPITHLLVSWTVAEQTQISLREKKLVTWAGVVPDLDGLTIIPDVFNRATQRPLTDYFFRYHHALTHGLPAAILISVALYFLAKRKVKVALLAFLTVHLHLACDLVGSRGPDPGDIWPIQYLQPFSDRMTFVWTHQWPLNAWPNIALTIFLLALVFFRAVQRGYSPLSLFSQRADAAFVATLRMRFRRAQDKQANQG